MEKWQNDDTANENGTDKGGTLSPLISGDFPLLVTLLFSRHRQMLLEESGITPDVIQERGYRSVETKAELRRLGFTDAQCCVPGLLIPVYGTDGELKFYQHRPDEPRIVGGKPAKYETPPKTRMAIDVPPCARAKLGDPMTPLFVTEGAKKADAAVSKGLCCVALLGVWNWRGTNEDGGKVALADWEDVALKGRDVYLVFDSDVMRKPAVHHALDRLSNFLKKRDANVSFVYLPEEAGEGTPAKVGLDDFLRRHTVEELLALAAPTLRQPPRNEEDQPLPYAETPHGLAVLRRGREGETFYEHITNFTAQITREIVEDDGVETRRIFEISVQQGGETTRFTEPAATFGTMNWVTERAGAKAILFPGMGNRDHARAAIQSLSQPERVRVWTCTGWVQLAGGWGYCHAGGVIGAAPEETCLVQLGSGLDRYLLPAPPQGKELIRAIRASLRLLRLGDPAVVVPVYAAVYRAPLGTCDFSLFLVGPTGVFKSEVAALAQRHYGASMDARNLPGAWSSTSNALEAQAFHLRDALFVADDFAPTGSSYDVQQLHGKAERLLRAQGNNSGRLRLRADATFRPPKPPRGLMLSTGEDVPRGHSVRSRALVLEVGPRSVRIQRLSRCQRDADAGRYAEALAGYLAWLAPQYEQVRAGLRSEVEALRQEATGSDLHRRTPEILANLAVGLRHFLRFASEVGAITSAQRDALFARAWEHLGQATRAQAHHHEDADPVERYLTLLSAAVASGRAHFTTLKGDRPLDAEACGWREEETGGNVGSVWRPKGTHIGWVKGEEAYLNFEVAFELALSMTTRRGEGISIDAKTLNKRLAERGFLLSMDNSRGVPYVRKYAQGASHNVLHLRKALIIHPGDNGPEPTPGYSEEREEQEERILEEIKRELAERDQEQLSAPPVQDEGASEDEAWKS